MGKQKKDAPAADTQPAEPTTVNETPVLTDAPATNEDSPEPDTATKRHRPKKPMTVPGATLADVFASYLDAMGKDGKSDGTISSYKMELALAGDELGLATRTSDITPERVLLYFGCDRLTKTRSGRSKSPLSIAKSRRVLRQALQHAEATGLVAKAPLPELAASH